MEGTGLQSRTRHFKNAVREGKNTTRAKGGRRPVVHLKAGLLIEGSSNCTRCSSETQSRISAGVPASSPRECSAQGSSVRARERVSTAAEPSLSSASMSSKGRGKLKQARREPRRSEKDSNSSPVRSPRGWALSRQGNSSSSEVKPRTGKALRGPEAEGRRRGRRSATGQR